MPKRCAFGCASSDVILHRYPNPDKFPERFKLWVAFTGGKLETAADYASYKRKRLCDLHFVEKDRNRYKRLNALAVPSVRLGDRTLVQPNENPTSPSLQAKPDRTLVQPNVNIPSPSLQAKPDGTLVQSNENHPSPSLQAEPAIITTRTQLLQEHNYSALSKTQASGGSSTKRPSFFYPNANLRTRIKILRSEISRLRRKGGNFKNRINNASELLDNKNFQQVVQNMSKAAQLFVQMQLQTSKKPKGRRFTIEEKVLSMCLYLY